MLKKMMKHLVNNPGLKVLSVLLSLVLWLAVVKMADPEKTKSFSVPVDILNKNVITEMGKVPDIVGDTDIAIFYISGPRSYVEDMSGDDFSVTADLSQIDFSQDGDVKLVPIEISAKKNDKRIDIIRRTVNMQIRLEDLSEEKFVISPEMIGTPAEGCAIGEVEVTPNLLKVSGPESIVSRISRVAAAINVDGISSDVSDNVFPVLYDEEGNVINSDLIEMNQASVTIKASILGTKNVMIRFRVSGTPADGCQYKGMEFAPETVQIKGEAAILNSINMINIPADVIDITGLSEDMDTTIDITPYLGEGISLVDETANQIAVKVMIERKESTVFNLDVKNIKVNNLLSTYELKYTGSTISVTVRARKEYMDGLKAKDLVAEIDVANLPPGTHLVPVALTLPSNQYEMVGTVNVQVSITDRNAQQVTPPQGEAPDVEQDEIQQEGAGPGASGEGEDPEEDGGNDEDGDGSGNEEESENGQ